jgi:hypothetical protein
MEIKNWHKIFNIVAIVLSLLLGTYFLFNQENYHYVFGLASFVVSLLFILNIFYKLNITVIFIFMIGYMLLGLLNWPQKDGEKLQSLEGLIPSLLPFLGFIVLALLYWENRNKF